MRAASILIFGFVLAVAGACGDSDGDIAWQASFDGGESSGTSTGGTTIGARGTLQTLPASTWVFEMPVPFPDAVPPADLDALGRAMLAAGPDRDVLDAIETPPGVVALLRDPAGGMELALLGPELARTASAPAGAEQVVLAGEEPLAVWVVLPDGLASLATLVRESFPPSPDGE